MSEYYVVRKHKTPEIPKDGFVLMTAACMDCLLCGSNISGMGGPGEALCIPCGEDLLSGRLRYNRSQHINDSGEEK